MNANVYSQQKKSPVCVETCLDLTQPCIKFLSLNANTGIFLDWVKICKNDHSLWSVNSEIQVI